MRTSTTREWAFTLTCIGATSLMSGCVSSRDESARSIAEVERAELRLKQAIRDNDVAVLAELASDDLAYLDISGGRVPKSVLIARREKDDRHTGSEIESEREVIALSPTVVLIRARSDTVATYYGGLPRAGWGRDSWIWRKEADGQWRVVHAQATRGVVNDFPVKVRVTLPSEAVSRFAGSYLLEDAGHQTLVLRADKDELHASLAGHLDDMRFQPDGERTFFATERAWELRFDAEANHITVVTWGVETKGVRVK